MGTRREARELALQALYQLDMAGEGEAAFWSQFAGDGETRAFAQELVEESRSRAAGIYVIPPFREPTAALDLLGA